MPRLSLTANNFSFLDKLESEKLQNLLTDAPVTIATFLSDLLSGATSAFPLRPIVDVLESWNLLGVLP